MSVGRIVGQNIVLPAFRRVRLLREVSSYVEDHLGKDGYGSLSRRFVSNGRHSRWGEDIRREIVDRFEHVHRSVEIHSSRADALFIAEAMLSLTAEGAIVECGCFAGGTTAKLSILATLLGRPLLVFDSFEGLPEVDAGDVVDYHSRIAKGFTWKRGACRAPLDLVRSNVERFGAIAACTFVKGWFHDTLTSSNLPASISLAYTDVVLAGSARDCLIGLWPRLPDGAVYFSRDVAFTKVLQGLLDERLWRDVLREFPPILFGAGYGLRDTSPHLGFMVKGRALPAEYIDSLMLEKAAGDA